MTKKLILFLPLLVFVILFASRISAASSVSGHKIVIDPGHGGSDSGSTACQGLPEKIVTLDIANRLKILLEDQGAQVFLTRTGDLTKSNNDRYTYANSVGGEALVSIHLNGSTNHATNGTKGFWGKKNKDQAFTKVIHSRMPTELGVPDQGISNFASGVLLKSNMPSTISETVYISNTAECNLLKDGTGTRQQQIANSLYNGLSDWFVTH